MIMPCGLNSRSSHGVFGVRYIVCDGNKNEVKGVRPLPSYSNSFGFEMEKDAAGGRALNLNYYCRRRNKYAHFNAWKQLYFYK